ncbi:MAG TPA: ABC transporter permease [Vicinamibacterales bacterium]
MSPRRFRLWLRSLVLRRRLERELHDEMAAHLAADTERWIALGLTPEEARRRARREFGNMRAIQEDARDARGGRGLESIIADLRFGIRIFGRKPVATLTMIAVFALGIGVNTALFVLLNSFVNGPLPGMSRQESVVRIRGIDRRRPGSVIGREFSYPEFREYAAHSDLFSAVAAWTSSDVVIDVGAREENLHSAAATYVTAGYFQVLGVHPIMGVGLPTDGADDAAAPPLVAVISHVVWEQHFGSAPDVVGRTLKVNDFPVTIVGVAPRRFNGARTGGSRVRVWLPLSARPQLQRTTPSLLRSYDSAIFGIVARLQPGVEIDRTIPTVETIAARAAQQATPDRPNYAQSTEVVTLLGDNYFPPSGESPDMLGRFTTLLIPVLVLAITCTNVSTLLAGLAVARRREIAVRLSLGAARRRIVRQLLTESALLALAAGALGLFIIWISLKMFDSSVPDMEIVLDWRVLLYTVGFALATGIVFGISPALHATRLGLSDVLKNAAGSVVAARSRLQSGLVIAQIALTQPALLGMGALILEMTADLGEMPSSVHADRILDVGFNTNPRYGSMDQNREETLRRLQARFASLAGVVAVVAQERSDDYFDILVHPADRVPGGDVDFDLNLVVRAQAAPPGYFSLMGIPIVRGRDFDAAIDDGGGAVVIGADLARRLWGQTDPIGRRFSTASPNRRSRGGLTIVGVVDDSRAGTAGGDANRIYLPTVRVTSHLLIRTRGPAQPAIPEIRSVANTEAPELPLVRVSTLAATEASQRRSIVQAITAAGGGGALALFLSAIGLYAVVSFAVGQRVREIGIRTALGAGRQEIVRLFLLRGLRLSLVGLALGLTFSIIVVRLMALARGEDFQPSVVWLVVPIACVVTSVALAASWIPARRAAHVDPLDALRSE